MPAADAFNLMFLRDFHGHGLKRLLSVTNMDRFIGIVVQCRGAHQLSFRLPS